MTEGRGRGLGYGATAPGVLTRLRWFIDKLGPALATALRLSGGLPLKPLIARGLTMGDENHLRNQACSALFLRALAPALARAVSDQAELARVFEFLGGKRMVYPYLALALDKPVPRRRGNITSRARVIVV